MRFLNTRRPMRLTRPVVLVAVASMLSLLASIALIVATADWARPTPIAGDPLMYRQIAEWILDGAVPYRDITVEHLPVMLLPIVGVGAITRLTGIDYTWMWALITIACVVASVVLARAISLADRYQARFAVAVIPMLPLVIFRLEIFVVLLALAALVAYERSQHRGASVWTLAGALAKGWPIALFAVPLRRGAMRLAVAGTAVSGLVLVFVAVLPGFRAGRAFTGIHTETIVGNLLLLSRHATGAELGLVGVAGATYVEAPPVAAVMNAAIGLAVGIVALVAIHRTTELVALVRICGLATLAIILASPLFSAQFVFWLVPFVPLLAVAGRRLALLVSALSMLVAALWNPVEPWWAAEVAVRNLAVVALVVVWITEVSSSAPLELGLSEHERG